jgi:hypothetical protein
MMDRPEQLSVRPNMLWEHFFLPLSHRTPVEICSASRFLNDIRRYRPPEPPITRALKRISFEGAVKVSALALA